MSDVCGVSYGVRIHGRLPVNFEKYLWPIESDCDDGSVLRLYVEHRWARALPPVDELWVSTQADGQPESRFSLFRQPEGFGLKVSCQGQGLFRIAPSRISIEWLPGGTGAAHYFFSSALPLWLEMNGILVLHASAVSYGDRAVAFVGESGAGKSSMCQALVQRGAAFVCDDGLAVAEHPQGEWQCQAGPPLFKLWPSAMNRELALELNELRKVHERFEKREVPLHQRCSRGRLGTPRLDTIYIIERQADAGGGVQTIPCTGSDALVRLVEFSLSGAPAAALDWAAPRLKRLGRLADKISVKRLVYPNGLDYWQRINDKIIQDIGLADTGTNTPQIVSER